MDAIKFINEANRMCHLHDFCNNCPAFDSLGPCKILYSNNYSAEEKLSIVEKWSKEHPIKTRQNIFLEQYPEAEIDENGCLMLCPITVSADKRNRHEDCTTLKCTDCRREFWMKEIE